jgi:hypothetical protein
VFGGFGNSFIVNYIHRITIHTGTIVMAAQQAGALVKSHAPQDIPGRWGRHQTMLRNVKVLGHFYNGIYFSHRFIKPLQRQDEYIGYLEQFCGLHAFSANLIALVAFPLVAYGFICKVSVETTLQ